MKHVEFKNFLGINNRLPDTSLRVATSQLNGQYLKDAVDADINGAGELQTRSTFSLVQAMTGAHSVFELSENSMLLVRASVLYLAIASPYSEGIVKILSSDAKMSYVEHNGSVYCSNGVDNGRVVSGVWSPMSLNTPVAPTLSVIGGNLDRGQYLVRLSYQNSVSGEEGGVGQSASTNLTSVGGIRVTLPSGVDGATHVNIYVSNTNGEVCYLAASRPVGDSTYDIIDLPTGREASERYETSLPGGELFISGGRLCSFSGATLHIGLPYRFGYYSPSSGYITFESDITVATGVEGGTYVCADKTYFIPGDLGGDGVVSEPCEFGAISGTLFSLEEKDLVGWFTPKGFALATSNGEVSFPMIEKVDVGSVAQSSSIVISSDYLRVHSCGWTINCDNGAATRNTIGATSSSGRFVTTSQGLCEISTGDIASTVNFGKINFGVTNEKRIPNCYLGVECEDPMTLALTTASGEEFEYDARGAGELDIQRVDIGKGLRANWFEIELKNLTGKKYTLATVSFAHAISNRRI